MPYYGSNDKGQVFETLYPWEDRVGIDGIWIPVLVADDLHINHCASDDLQILKSIPFFNAYCYVQTALDINEGWLYSRALPT